MAKINLLDPLLSSRIAAGEIIERPQSVLREFLDNAIDSGADDITVVLHSGGIDELKVIDNGKGISREDLDKIGFRHATSKIKTNDDLYNIRTLGFRGEALYSISSVSRFTISTFSEESGEKSTLTIDNGRRTPVTFVGPDRGTIVTSEDLFKEIPARRNFLKRSSVEAQMCRSLLISKALAFPNISFTLKVDGETKLKWDKANTPKDRVMMLYREYNIFSNDVDYLEEETEDYSVKIVSTNSAVKRSDKKEIRVYVNNRPVDEYSLIQAVLYGYGELLPGGSYPYTSLFITDKPEYIDFNIHPTKREVKIRNISSIHHTISTMLKNGIERKIPEIKVEKEFYLDDAFRWENEKKVETFAEKNTNYAPESYSNTYKPSKDWLEKAKKLKEAELKTKKIEAIEIKEEKKDEIIYIGQLFKLFLVCQKDNEAYLIDQHAAHERIIYDEIISQETVQNLLIPIEIEVDNITDDYLYNNCYIYNKLGIMLVRKEKGLWEITATPVIVKGREKELVDFVLSCKSDEHELEEKLFATMACRAAIKMGDEVDKWTAESIIEKVFKMDEPTCPHGRTFLIRMTKENLMKMVGRGV